MKLSILVLALSFIAFPFAKADSFQVTGAKADALVDSLVHMGLDPVGTHEYFQSGVTACAAVFDDQGGYFPNGKIGDYVGEACLIYGDAEGADEDGALRIAVSIPADDRDLSRHPDIRKELEKMKNVRLALEALVVPIVKTSGTTVVSRTTGIAGLACEGRDRRGQRVCRVLPSSLCPPR